MKYKLKNNLEIEVREAKVTDAQILIDYMNKVISETANLMREPDEFKLTIEQEEGFIKRIQSSDDAAMILVFDKELLIASAGIHGNSLRRVKHKVEIGISVLEKYHNLGVGSVLMKAIIKKAKEMKKHKIELEVRNDNLGAIHLYEKFGFITEGIKEKSFFAENKYLDLRQMALFLEE